ncbi:xanthine dehydrogenase family protein subunit M [Candidatus Acetothermia bacterium]|nr:xanthine dehydrogenase family protein subunit M [Candidatus Acetothermia bacterium]
MIPSKFEYHAPQTLPKALRLLAEHKEDAKLLAGGQSLVPAMKLRLATPVVLIDLNRVGALRYVTQKDDHFAVGAMATHYMLESARTVLRKCPLLAQVASHIGDVQVRNRGTIGGSLVHADPAADWPTAILALDAELKLSSARGERTVKASEFFRGLFTTAIEPDEILTEIKVSAFAPRTGSTYVKVEQPASGFALCGVAAMVTVNEQGICQDARVAITGVTDKQIRARGVETALKGQKLDSNVITNASTKASEGITSPLDDIHASGDYRLHLARTYTKRALTEAVSRAK